MAIFETVVEQGEVSEPMGEPGSVIDEVQSGGYESPETFNFEKMESMVGEIDAQAFYGYVDDPTGITRYQAFQKVNEALNYSETTASDKFQTLHQEKLSKEDMIERVTDAGFELVRFCGESLSLWAIKKETGATLTIEVSYPENYIQLECFIYGPLSRMEEIEDSVNDNILFDAVVDSHSYQLHWTRRSCNGLATSQEIKLLSDNVIPEAYPYIEGGIDRFAHGYLSSPASLLLLHGKQGTGKTRMIRHIVKTECDRTSGTPKVLYTSDKDTMKDEELFVKLSTGSYDCLVLEGADELLQDRSESSDKSVVHKFLSVTDGFASSDRKIILSTNMKLGSIDPALIRPGRCFAVQEFKALTTAQANTLIDALDEDCERSADTSMTIAEIYNLVFEYSTGTEYHPEEIGYKTDSNSVGFC